MPSPLREACSCWKAEKLCRHFYRKCWTMDFRDGNLHNATLFCSQKSCIASPPFTSQIFRHHRKIKPLRKNGYKRTGIRHKFCCLFIPVRLSRECAIFFNGFILYFIPTLLLQSLLRVSILPTAAPQSIYYRFHRKQIHTVDLSTSVQVEYISLLHEFFQ